MPEFDAREVLQTIRPNIAQRKAYVSGAQKDFWIKANQNECPYEPSPQVITAISDPDLLRRLNRYPDRNYPRLIPALSRHFGVPAEYISVANGSDEILSIVFRTFVDPTFTLGTTDPTYSMIPVDSEEQNARYQTVKLKGDGTLPIEALIELKAHLTVVVNPGTPYGVLTPKDGIEELARVRFPYPVLVDEAYMDFALPNTTAIDLVHKYPNVIVARTLSKSFAIAGLRVGCAIADPLIAGYLESVRQPFPITPISEVGAVAALNDFNYAGYIQNAIIAGRDYLTRELKRMKNGQAFDVPPSQANFVFAKCKIPRKAKELFEKLDERGIGVRAWLDDPELVDGIRITVSKLEEDSKVIQEIEKSL